MIADLENEWGVTLLERSRIGTQLLPYARTLIADYQKMAGAVDEMNGLQKLFS